jgi:serine/threonine protein kinase
MFTKTGTPLYTAPEIHTDGANRYSESIDMWGAGTVLYLLLSGDRPFNESQ